MSHIQGCKSFPWKDSNTFDTEESLATPSPTTHYWMPVPSVALWRECLQFSRRWGWCSPLWESSSHQKSKSHWPEEALESVLWTHFRSWTGKLSTEHQRLKGMKAKEINQSLPTLVSRQCDVEPDRITYSTLIKGYCVAGQVVFRSSQWDSPAWFKLGLWRYKWMCKWKYFNVTQVQITYVICLLQGTEVNEIQD